MNKRIAVPPQGGGTRRKWGAIAVHALLAAGAIVMIVPFLWMALTAFKTLGESTQVPPVLFPKRLQWRNFEIVTEVLPFGRFYLNTIVVTIAKTAGQLLFCSLAAYAFARIVFPGRQLFFLAALSVLMVPYQVFIIPQYLIMKDMGWLNSLTALIVPGLFSAFGTFLLRQFFLSLPKETEEAAKIDGCSHFGIYARVMLPLTKPALTAMTILVVMWSWNDLLWPLIVINSPESMPLSVGVALLQMDQHTTNFPIMMAGALLAVWPLIAIFAVFQKQFIEGIALTGSK